MRDPTKLMNGPYIFTGHLDWPYLIMTFRTGPESGFEKTGEFHWYENARTITPPVFPPQEN